MTKARRTAFAFVFISGLMLGACAVQLKDELSLHYGTLGFDQIARCLSMGPGKGPFTFSSVVDFSRAIVRGVPFNIVGNVKVAGQRVAANLLTKDEARGIAVNIAKLPDLLRKVGSWGLPKGEVIPLFHRRSEGAIRYRFRKPKFKKCRALSSPPLPQRPCGIVRTKTPARP